MGLCVCACVRACVCVCVRVHVRVCERALYLFPVMQPYPDIRGDSQYLAVHQIIHKHVLLPAKWNSERQWLWLSHIHEI